MRGAPESVDVAAFVADVKAKVDARLDVVLADHVRRAREAGEPAGAIAEAFASLVLRGGKRLRPAIVAAGFRALGGDGLPSSVIDAGCAWELLQAYFLVHDDWMDGDETRRGGPAVHKVLRDRFGSDAFGVLAGDYGCALAHEVIADVDAPAARVRRVGALFAKTHGHVVVGQALDLAGVDDPAAVERCYAFKTASYTTRGPLLTGALLAFDAVEGDLEARLTTWARCIGVAFQHVDDLLGAFGDEKSTGKPVGSDLASGKKTYLATLARSRTRVAGTIADMRAAIEACGAKRDVEARVATLRAKADEVLEGSCHLAADGKALLRGFASALLDRSR